MTTKVRAGVRSVADVFAGKILASVEIAAAPERVFRALSTDELTSWWGSDDEYRTTKWTGDLRPGGAWRTEGVGKDGTTFAVGGEFREIDPPRKIVQTWVAPWDGNNETVITYLLEPIDGGTRLTVRHEGFGDRAESCAGHANGWERVLGWLVGYVSKDERKYFFCRLLGPRPSFPFDISADERAIMGAHAAYWATMLGGAAVVLGPVHDGAGAWGLGVIRASTEDEARALWAKDPAVVSGKGFRYELLPMLSAMTKA